MPIIIGGVLAGAALLLYMRSQSSQQVVSNQPTLTLYPSTEADTSNLANAINSINALASSSFNPGTGSGSGGSGSGGSGGGGTGGSGGGSGGSGGGGTGGTGGGSGGSGGGKGKGGGGGLGGSGGGGKHTSITGFQLVTGTATGGAKVYAGKGPADTLSNYLTAGGNPALYGGAGGMYGQATDLSYADPTNPAEVTAIANAYYRGDTAKAIQGITNSQVPGNTANDQRAIGNYLNNNPGATQTQARQALGLPATPGATVNGKFYPQESVGQVAGNQQAANAIAAVTAAQNARAAGGTQAQIDAAYAAAENGG